jgi:8-oxo-dGTP pyrophosphatase MutT (NUDIX family)
MNPRPAAFVLLRHPRDHERVLLSWHPPSRLWGLPGGKVEEGEGLAAAARRELREETGLDFSGALWPLASGMPTPEQDWPGRTPRRLVVFEIRDGELLEERVPAPRIPETAAWMGPEGNAVRWGTLEELVPFFGRAFAERLGLGTCNTPSPFGLRCVRPVGHGDSRSTGHRDARGVTWATEARRRAGNAKGTV